MDKEKNKKMEADGLIKLSVYFLRQNGFFNGLVSGNIRGIEGSYHILVSTSHEYGFFVHFSYASLQPDGKYKNFGYRVNLEATLCTYGGLRYWFRCPLTIGKKCCGKRVGVLYKAGDFFGCRHCYNLTYESRRWRYKGKPTKRLMRLKKEACKLKWDQFLVMSKIDWNNIKVKIVPAGRNDVNGENPYSKLSSKDREQAAIALCGKIWSRHIREKLTQDNDKKIEEKDCRAKLASSSDKTLAEAAQTPPVDNLHPLLQVSEACVP